MSPHRHARTLRIQLPDGVITDGDPLPDDDTAHGDEPHCQKHHPACEAIVCARRPHTRGLCYAVHRSPYWAAYWTKDDD